MVGLDFGKTSKAVKDFTAYTTGTRSAWKAFDQGKIRLKLEVKEEKVGGVTKNKLEKIGLVVIAVL